MPSGTLRARRRWERWYESATYLVGVYGGGVFAGAARGSQFVLNSLCGRVRDPFRVLERRHGLVEIVERGSVVLGPVCPVPLTVRGKDFRPLPANLGLWRQLELRNRLSELPPRESASQIFRGCGSSRGTFEKKFAPTAIYASRALV